MDIDGKPMIYHVINRIIEGIRPTGHKYRVVVATTVYAEDDDLVSYVHTLKTNIDIALDVGQLDVFRGQSEDVLGRFYSCGIEFHIPARDIICRITGDNPHVEPTIIRNLCDTWVSWDNDYRLESYLTHRGNPYGTDAVELFPFDVIRTLHNVKMSYSDREHVTQHIHQHPHKFSINIITQEPRIDHLRMTIDTEDDYKYATSMIKHNGYDIQTLSECW